MKRLFINLNSALFRGQRAPSYGAESVNRIPVFRNTALLLLIFFCWLQVPAQAIYSEKQTWESGQVIFDEHQWVEVIVGDLPLVISVPHGGALHEPTIPDRSCDDLGRVVKVRDSKTIETARAIEAAFLKKFKKRPYIIISHISRRKVDQNRDVDLGTCGHPSAIAAWEYFHNSIDTALTHANLLYGKALYIDLHGHGHKNQRLELGYNLSSGNLQDAFKKKNLSKLFARSSLQNNLRGRGQDDFWEALYGKYAFGSLIYAQGVPATPSLQDPYPQSDEAFFSGGYNTRRYTSEKYPKVWGWQIEANYKGIRDTPDHRQSFAEAFVNAYQTYIQHN